MAVCLCLIALAACGRSPPPLGVVGHITGNFGGAVSDEPRATLIARDVLSAGGTATDAVVALYFALAATYPSAAGLGGGGVCVVHDGKTGKAETIDFTARPPSRPAPAGTVAFAVPGAVRGMFALHSRYGRLRWAQVVFPGERLARFGNPVSRSFAAELKQGARRIAGDRDARKLFLRRDGSPLREGDDLQQLDLAGVLGKVRAQGAGVLYNGALSRNIVAGAAAAGGSLSIADLRDYRPTWHETVRKKWTRHDVHFPPPSVAGGAVAVRLWDMLKEQGRYRQARRSRHGEAVIDAELETYKALPAGRPTGRLPDAAVTGFSAIDAAGGAAACTVTMNGRFGTGRMIRGTGMFAAAPPRPGRDGRASLAAMVIVNRFIFSAYFAGAASGDAAAPASLITVALRVLLDGETLKAAIDAGRAHTGGVRDTVFVEKDVDAAMAGRLGARGLRVRRVAALARVNAIYCPRGTRYDPDACSYVTDPRGFGYAASAGR